MSKKVDNQSEQNNKNVEEVIGNSSESKNINDKERLISNLGVEIQRFRLDMKNIEYEYGKKCYEQNQHEELVEYNFITERIVKIKDINDHYAQNGTLDEDELVEKIKFEEAKLAKDYQTFGRAVLLLDSNDDSGIVESFREKNGVLLTKNAELGGIYSHDYRRNKEKGDEAVIQAMRETTHKMQAVFGDQWYEELLWNDSSEQVQVNLYIVQLADEFDLELIATTEALQSETDSSNEDVVQEPEEQKEEATGFGQNSIMMAKVGREISNINAELDNITHDYGKELFFSHQYVDTQEYKKAATIQQTIESYQLEFESASALNKVKLTAKSKIEEGKLVKALRELGKRYITAADADVHNELVNQYNQKLALLQEKTEVLNELQSKLGVTDLKENLIKVEQHLNEKNEELGELKSKVDASVKENLVKMGQHLNEQNERLNDLKSKLNSKEVEEQKKELVDFGKNSVLIAKVSGEISSLNAQLAKITHDYGKELFLSQQFIDTPEYSYIASIQQTIETYKRDYETATALNKVKIGAMIKIEEGKRMKAFRDFGEKYITVVNPETKLSQRNQRNNPVQNERVSLSTTNTAEDNSQCSQDSVKAPSQEAADASEKVLSELAESKVGSSASIGEGFVSDVEAIGPILPFLHGTMGQQRLVTVGMASLLTLLMVINMGGWGFLASAFLCALTVLAAIVLQMTSRVRVKFTNFTNCLNVMFIATFILMILGKLLGEALMNVDPTDMAKFFNKYERNTFMIGFFMCILNCVSLFSAGRLVWSRNFKEVWKASTIVSIFIAVYYLVIMPYVVLNAYDLAKSMI